MQEEKKKRPIFTPIVLLLLTMSLMGNVALYTQKIQNDHDKRVARGNTIIQSGNETKKFFQEVAATAQHMLDKQDIASRLEDKSKLLAAFQEKPQVIQFIKEAETSNGKPFEGVKTNAEDFFKFNENSLLTLFNHDGPLEANEMHFLQALVKTYRACSETMQPFDHDTWSATSALTILVDQEWVAMGKKLAQSLSDSPVLTISK
ncbi:hypothetical protein A8990_102144 [Paenibacillus taihuensis]|uniref:Uncharacterized protein n=1 Tax=Paenibacillus taihuensis TaxID=1156355 RepID=A0A3D9SDU8_9BACL|nr:hypothetical protein [Paenibacillus taihuensis]REE93058.1 hypothetical protein A8990_102144 [Paenibacillus taihuensis]